MKRIKKKEKLHLKLKGKTAVYIDWANVHGWEEKLKWEIDLKKLYKYLATLYKRLIARGKKIIVVATKWSLGKEIAQIRRGLFILKVTKLEYLANMRISQYQKISRGFNKSKAI